MSFKQEDRVISVSIPTSVRQPAQVANYAAVVGAAPQNDSTLRRIAQRYNPSTMDGPETLLFATDLISAGFDATDALAVSWPISRRNLLEKGGRHEAAPKVDDWADVLRHHQTQRNLAKSRHNFVRAVHIDRLIRIAGDLRAAAA